MSWQTAVIHHPSHWTFMVIHFPFWLICFVLPRTLMTARLSQAVSLINTAVRRTCGGGSAACDDRRNQLIDGLFLPLIEIKV